MTILYKNDWRDAQGRLRAIPHTTTKNHHFVRMCVHLSRMGIKNNMFHMALYDPKLMDVDPHALDDITDPTGELRLRVAIESRRNLWYYLREIVRIPAAGGDPIRFKLNRGNLSMAWCFMNSIDYNGTQPRQTGKAQPLTARVFTPNGWVTMGSLAIGDQVLTPSGEVTRIVGIHNQNVVPIHSVTLDDGRATECCDEHIWRVYHPTFMDGWEELTLREIRILRGKEGMHDLTVPVKDVVTGELTYQGIHSIDYVGNHPAQCIELEHPDGLYITDEGIVTHNTIGAITLTSWVLYINGYNMSMTMLTHSDKLVQENVKRLKDIRASLPPYLISKSGDDIDNKQGLDYKALKNSYLTYIGQKDKQAANRVGRGSTSPSIHFDELAFIPNIKITFPAIMAATNTARQNAARAGMVHSNLYTTTAGDPSTEEGAFAFGLIQRAMPFTEKLYDCKNLEDATRMVKTNSPIQLVNGTFSYLQLGETHEWFHDTIARNNVPPDEVQRDYLNNWVSLAKNPIISKEILSQMAETQRPDPDYKEIIGDYIINWYVPEATVRSRPFKDRLLFLGMDSSENIGKDFTTFVCIDPATLATVFTFRCNDSNTTKIGMLVARILSEYRRMLFIPERKSSGVFITDMVINSMERMGQNPFVRIFNKVVQERQYQEFSSINLNDPTLCQTVTRKYLGFMTTAGSRSILFKQVLQRAASIARSIVYDPALIVELSGLQANNGRIDHRAGRHDDMVIAWLLACFVVFEGKNLEYYGIRKEELIKIMDMGLSGSGADYEKMHEQLELRKILASYDEKIARASSPQLKNHWIHERARLEVLVDASIVLEPISVDVVQKDFREYEAYTQPLDKGELPRTNPRFAQSGNSIFNAVQGGLGNGSGHQGSFWSTRN